jgi:hypothetical protein
LKLEPLLRAEITLAPPQELGEKLAGRVLPGGADWQFIRADGVAELDARYTLETEDCALIYVRNFGYRHDASLYYTRTTPRFETGAERYQWLNRIICVATGARKAAAVELEVFEVK